MTALVPCDNITPQVAADTDPRVWHVPGFVSVTLCDGHVAGSIPDWRLILMLKIVKKMPRGTQRYATACFQTGASIPGLYLLRILDLVVYKEPSNHRLLICTSL